MSINGISRLCPPFPAPLQTPGTGARPPHRPRPTARLSRWSVLPPARAVALTFMRLCWAATHPLLACRCRPVACSAAGALHPSPSSGHRGRQATTHDARPAPGSSLLYTAQPALTLAPQRAAPRHRASPRAGHAAASCRLHRRRRPRRRASGRGRPPPPSRGGRSGTRTRRSVAPHQICAACCCTCPAVASVVQYSVTPPAPFSSS